MSSTRFSKNSTPNGSNKSNGSNPKFTSSFTAEQQLLSKFMFNPTEVTDIKMRYIQPVCCSNCLSRTTSCIYSFNNINYGYIYHYCINKSCNNKWDNVNGKLVMLFNLFPSMIDQKLVTYSSDLSVNASNGSEPVSSRTRAKTVKLL